MNSKEDQATPESTSAEPETTEEPPRSKLRDLRPEKDPMGAAKPVPSRDARP